ncbi:MAG: flagellar basal body-associated FliL family protein [Terriglobales bacterium]
MQSRHQPAWALLLLLVPLLGGCSLLHHGSKKVQAAAALPLRVIKLDSNVYNLADTAAPAYLRLGISLAVTNPDEKTDSTTTSVARDTLVDLVTNETSAALLTAAGKAALKKALLAALQQRLPAAGVRQVYFDQFLIQP